MFASLPIAANVALFIAAAAVVWVAGSRLAGLADAIATRTGIGRAFLGMILLGAATSLPELAIAVTAGISGTPAITTNDVLGSAATNVLILAVADAFVRGRPLSSAHHSSPLLLQGALGIVLLAIVLGPSITGDRVIFGIGGWSWLLLVTYIASVRLVAKSHVEAAWGVDPAGLRKKSEPRPGAGGESDGSSDHDESAAEGLRSGRKLAALTASVGAAILVAGFLLARSGEALAEQTGLGAGFFAIVFLAIATSLPEISTVIGAVRLKRYEMAIADVLGTNLFNVTIIVLSDALYSGGPVLIEVGPTAGFGALLALLVTATFLVGMLERRDRTLFGVGYDSLAIVAMYLAGVATLYHLR